jgi:hypothetical protein
MPTRGIPTYVNTPTPSWGRVGKCPHVGMPLVGIRGWGPARGIRHGASDAGHPTRSGGHPARGIRRGRAGIRRGASGAVGRPSGAGHPALAIRRWSIYLPKIASIFAAGPVRLSTSEATNVSTIRPAEVNAIDELRPAGVVR